MKNVVISLGILYVPFIARVVRGVTLVQREMAYTEAAGRWVIPSDESSFGTSCRIDLDPSSSSRPSTSPTPCSIIAALSFLGLGVQPPTPDWGTMLSEGQGVLLTSPHLSLAAGFMSSSSVLGFNLLGDGLSDVLDPRQGQR